jgi:type II secretory pathway pseudopilin PulG
MNLIFINKKRISRGFTRTLILLLELKAKSVNFILDKISFIKSNFYYKSRSVRRKVNLVSGFTLVEALVAISILMVAVTSPMMIAQKSLSTAILTKDQMTASFLAQDAIESVKNIRDEIAINASSTTDWLINDSNPPTLAKCICTSDDECNFDKEDGTENPNVKYCNIDTTRATFGASSIRTKGDPYPLNPLGITKDLVNGSFVKYDFSNTTKSKFSRKINIRRQGLVPGGACDTGEICNEAVVNVRVSWNSAFGVQNIDIKNFIYNSSEIMP